MLQCWSTGILMLVDGHLQSFFPSNTSSIYPKLTWLLPSFFKCGWNVETMWGSDYWSPTMINMGVMCLTMLQCWLTGISSPFFTQKTSSIYPTINLTSPFLFLSVVEMLKQCGDLIIDHQWWLTRELCAWSCWDVSWRGSSPFPPQKPAVYTQQLTWLLLLVLMWWWNVETEGGVIDISKHRSLWWKHYWWDSNVV